MRSLKGILEQVLRSTPNFDTKMKDIEVIDAWPRAVGERMAAHCIAERMVEPGVLLVAATSSAWLQNIRFLEPQIIEKLEQTLGQKRVRALKFKLQNSR